MLTESREAMNLSLVAVKPCDCILIVATLRRQPISAASGNVRVLPVQAATLMCCRDGAGGALMEIYRRFESG
jgi:hypothetical protein